MCLTSIWTWDIPKKHYRWLTLGIEEYKEEEDFLAAMADCYRSGDHDRASNLYL